MYVILHVINQSMIKSYTKTVDLFLVFKLPPLFIIPVGPPLNMYNNYNYS